MSTGRARSSAAGTRAARSRGRGRAAGTRGIPTCHGAPQMDVRPGSSTTRDQQQRGGGEGAAPAASRSGQPEISARHLPPARSEQAEQFTDAQMQGELEYGSINYLNRHTSPTDDITLRPQ